jgi:hypothetical protein
MERYCLEITYVCFGVQADGQMAMEALVSIIRSIEDEDEDPSS